MKHALIALLLWSPIAFSDVEIGPTLGVAGSERLKDDWGWQARVGGDVYVVGSYEKRAIKMVGQPLAKTDVWGAGLGYRNSDDWFTYFVEIGYFWPDVKLGDEAVVWEAVSRSLINDHGPIPFRPHHVDYKLEGGWGGRVGIAYQAARHITVSAAYRALKLREGYDVCTGGDPKCKYPVDGLHWQNRKTLDFSGWEFGVWARF